MTRPVALVTGGSRGIGLACVEALAAAGFDLVVADVPPTSGKDLHAAVDRHGANLHYAPFDLGNLATHASVVDSTIEAFGSIDCLVNNAGIASPVRGDLIDLKPENFDTVLSVNLRGTMFFTQAIAKTMLGRSGPRPRSIVTITSVSAEMASPERADYCVSKAGLSMWVKNLALRVAADGIGVFEVRPGIIRSDMTAAVTAKYDALIESGLVPASRWGEGSDVAAIVAAIAGGTLGFATGSVINADGALSVARL